MKASKSLLNVAKIVALLFIIAVVACFGGCIFGDKGSSDTSNNQSKEKLNITDVTMTYEYSSYLGYTVKIEGTAKNLSGKNYSYASVEYSVYDEDGNNLGTALDNINHLANGDTWKFSATLLGFAETKPASYKLVEITTLIDYN